MTNEEFQRLVLEKLEDHDRQFDQLHQMTADLIRIVGNTNAMVEELRKDVDELKQEMAVVKQDIVVMKKDIEAMKQDIVEIKYTQRRQEKILESLAVRTLEHDADIRDLRRAK